MLLDEAVSGHDGNVITAVSPAGAVLGWDFWVAPQRVPVRMQSADHPVLQDWGVFFSSNQTVTGKCQSLRLREILYSCCLSCRSEELMLIRRNLIHQPYRFLQLLLEGQGLICSLQQRRSGSWHLGSGTLPIFLAFKGNGIVSELPSSRSFNSLDFAWKGFPL